MNAKLDSMMERALIAEKRLSEALELAESNGKLAHDTAIQLREATIQRDKLSNAIRSFSTDFEDVRWGWDGDCGSKVLADQLFDEMTEIMKEPTP